MRIEFSATQALQHARLNPQRAWSGVKPRLMSGEVIDVAHSPKFTLDPAWPIFTMGSCFAREVEEVLIRRGVRVLTEGHGVENRYYAGWKWDGQPDGVRRGRDLGRGALNKYTVRSMLHEMRVVLGGETFPNEGLIGLPDGTWFDPHSAGLRKLDHATASTNRRRIAAASAEIRSAKAVFLTLGQTETWFDVETGLSMNAHPGPEWLRQCGDRFRFVDYGFDETRAQLVEMIELVRTHVDPGMKFVVTVSPVPLVNTFRPVDLVVANMATKTVLRAVAETIARSFDDVDYFPSYEMVACSPVSRAYEPDLAHVTPQTVEAVMHRFMAAYYPGLASAAPCLGPAAA